MTLISILFYLALYVSYRVIVNTAVVLVKKTNEDNFDVAAQVIACLLWTLIYIQTR
jgi:hypothetical protein